MTEESKVDGAQEAPKQEKPQSKARASKGGFRVKNLRKGVQVVAGEPVQPGSEHTVTDDKLKNDSTKKRVEHAIACGQLEKL